MSPVTQFEESARAVWRADLDVAEKSKRLTAIRVAILHYVDRIDANRKSGDQDAWAIRSLDRVRSYLVHLASDVADLTLECERRTVMPKPGSPPSAPEGPYAA